MSISVIIRPKSATSGGETKDISGDGTIDNKSEANEALGLLGSSDSVVIVGSETYDKTRLEAIRDGAGSAPTSGCGPNTKEVAKIQTTEKIPAGSRLFIFLDGNPVGDGMTLNADRKMSACIPTEKLTMGPHEVQYRIDRPKMPQLRFTKMTTVKPSVASLSAASIPSNNALKGGYYKNDPIKVQVTSDRVTRARINVGTHSEDVNLVAGVNTITLSGKPTDWPIGTMGKKESYEVKVQPLNDKNEPAGSSVTAGTVTIQKGWAGKGGSVSSGRPKAVKK